MPDNAKSILCPPRLRDAFHSRGAAAYSSRQAQREFAKALLKISNRLWWIPIALIVTTSLTTNHTKLAVQCVISAGLMCGAIYLRHYALIILDAIATESKSPRKSKMQKEAVLSTADHVCDSRV